MLALFSRLYGTCLLALKTSKLERINTFCF